LPKTNDHFYLALFACQLDISLQKQHHEEFQDITALPFLT
jgi:hypothetical protein